MSRLTTSQRSDNADVPDVRRYDFGELLAKPYRRASDGVMLAEAIVCREGILEYRQADGSIRRELVTRQAVEDTARTIARSAVTLEHPAEFVSPKNVDSYGVGDVDGETYVEVDGRTYKDESTQGAFCRVRTAIRRADAITGLERGELPDVSPGYTVVLDETPGEHPDFGRYDARQIGRTVNHLALTARGRGQNVPIRSDSADAVHIPAARRHDSPTEPTMNPKIVALATMLGLQIRSDAADADLLDMLAEKVKAKLAEGQQMKADLDEAKTAADGMVAQAEYDAACAQRDALQAELDSLKADMQEKKDAADLADLKALAEKLQVKLDADVTPAAARKAVAAVVVPDLRADASDDYVAALVDVARTRADGDKGKRDDSATKTRDDRHDGLRGGAKRDDAGDADRLDGFYSPDLDAADRALAGSAA